MSTTNAPITSDFELFDFVRPWREQLRSAPRDRATLESYRDGARARLPDLADILDLLIQLVDATDLDEVRRIEDEHQRKGEALRGPARVLWTLSDPPSVRGDIPGVRVLRRRRPQAALRVHLSVDVGRAAPGIDASHHRPLDRHPPVSVTVHGGSRFLAGAAQTRP